MIILILGGLIVNGQFDGFVVRRGHSLFARRIVEHIGRIMVGRCVIVVVVIGGEGTIGVREIGAEGGSGAECHGATATRARAAATITAVVATAGAYRATGRVGRFL